MSISYQAISFNPQKKIYDRIILLATLSYLAMFLVLSSIFLPEATAETLLLRATSTAAFIMLNIILVIGPLCRLNICFLPLLYNRRHLGVSMFLLAFFHGALAILQFHGFGDVNPLKSLFFSNTDYGSLINFPFQVLGFLALFILFLMAITSHDFWLANLSPPVWKFLHMMVYFAYALIILHVALGFLQEEKSIVYIVLFSSSLFFVLGLHLLSGFKEWKERKAILPKKFDENSYAFVCFAQEIPENRAKLVELSGERVAVFRYKNKISAVSNVCQHQNGPLGEGKVVDGCITCPWHGFQYRLEDGTSPPPFTEKIATYKVKITGENEVYVHPKPLERGTYVEPARLVEV